MSGLLDLSSLLGNGLLSQWLGGSGLNTPQPSPFQTPPSLFGSGILGRGIRGGLAGLAGSTGYQGWSAVGAGAQAGAQEERQRQLFAQQNALGGQQYQQGQLGIAGSYGNLAMEALRLSRITGKNITAQDLIQHPELMGNIFQSGGGNEGAPGVQPIGPIDPTAQGGQPESQFMMGPNGYGSSQLPAPPPSSGPVAAGNSGGSSDPTLAGLDQAISDDYLWNDGKGVAALEAKRAEYLGAPAQAGRVKMAEDAATFGSPQNTINNVKDISSAFGNEDAVKIYADAKPTFDSVVQAYNAYDPKQPAETQLPNDFNLASGVLKMINPKAANLRPNSVEAVEEAKGYQSLYRKVMQQLNGGTGLTAEVRNALLQVAQQHMASYQKEFDAVASTYRKRASLLGKGVTEDMWNPYSNETSAPGQPSYTKGSVVTDSTGKKWVYRGTGDPTDQSNWTPQ